MTSAAPSTQLALPFLPDLAPLPRRLLPRRPARIRVRGPTSLTFVELLERKTLVYKKRLTPEERAELALWPQPLAMPESWTACQARGLGWNTPCPHLRCRHHMALERTAQRTVKLLWGHVDLKDMPATCSLAAASYTRGAGMEVGQVARMTGLPKRTVERALASALGKLKAVGLAHLIRSQDG